MIANTHRGARGGRAEARAGGARLAPIIRASTCRTASERIPSTNSTAAHTIRWLMAYGRSHQSSSIGIIFIDMIIYR